MLQQRLENSSLALETCFAVVTCYSEHCSEWSRQKCRCIKISFLAKKNSTVNLVKVFTERWWMFNRWVPQRHWEAISLLWLVTLNQLWLTDTRMETNEARSLLGLLKKLGRVGVGGRKLFPVISHRLRFSHWEIIQIFPVKQSLCNLDHSQTKSRKQLQTERCEAQIKRDVSYNAQTIQCRCFLALAEVINIKYSRCGICGWRQILPDDVVWLEASYQVMYESWYSTDALFWYSAIMEKNIRYARNNFQQITHMPSALIFFMSPWSVRNAKLHSPTRNKTRNI